MKLNRLPHSTITSTLALTALIAGTLFTASAEDYNRGRHVNSQQNNRQYNQQPQQQQQRQEYRHDNQASSCQPQHQEYRRFDHSPSYQPQHYQYRNYNPGYSYHREIIRTLPQGHRSFCYNNQNYYFHRGVFYNRYDQGYVVVEPPRFYSLPRYARQVVVNRSIYYVCDDIYYQPCENYYVVCEPPVVEQAVVVCEPRPACHVESSLEINAGPVTVELSHRH